MQWNVMQPYKRIKRFFTHKDGDYFTILLSEKSRMQNSTHGMSLFLQKGGEEVYTIYI